MPAHSAMTPAQPVATVLASRYGLAVHGVVQLPIGQGTVNYRARCADRDVVVKTYLPGTDLAAERRSIALSELARDHGIPAAPVLANADADVIDTSTPQALSVWQWMPGQVVTSLRTPQYTRAGHALGRIHALFATLRESSAPTPQVEQWRNIDIAMLQATIEQLQDIIARRTASGIADAFDAHAARTLTERRAMLPRLSQLLAELPTDLTSQVLHGDYSPVNLLFAGDTLTAVLDFRPPDPFLLAYDVGRMAFYPNTVARGGWKQAARTFVTAYLTANPSVSDVDIRACGRVALVQLLGSLYGVKQHYRAPGVFQHDLDQFWLLRHHAVKVLLDHLHQTDQLLADLTRP